APRILESGRRVRWLQGNRRCATINVMDCGRFLRTGANPGTPTVSPRPAGRLHRLAPHSSEAIAYNAGQPPHACWPQSRLSFHANAEFRLTTDRRLVALESPRDSSLVQHRSHFIHTHGASDLRDNGLRGIEGETPACVASILREYQTSIAPT